VNLGLDLQNKSGLWAVSPSVILIHNPLLSAGPTVTFPAVKHDPLAGM